MRIDADRHDAGTGGGQCRAHRWVARVLQPDPVTRFDQHAQHQVDRLLGAGGHHHLFGLAAHRPAGAQIAGDGLAQRRRSRRIRIAQPRRVGPLQVPQRQATPDLQGAFVQRAAAGIEGGGPERSGLRLRAGKAPAGRRGGRRRGAGHRWRRCRRVRQVARHEAAGADPPLDEALGQQLFVGGDDRVAGDAEPGGQRPGRRQPATGRDGAGENAAAQLQIKLAQHGHRAVAVERHQHQVGKVSAHRDWSSYHAQNWPSRRTNT